jgi:hypothetical protein
MQMKTKEMLKTWSVMGIWLTFISIVTLLFITGCDSGSMESPSAFPPRETPGVDKRIFGDWQRTLYGIDLMMFLGKDETYKLSALGYGEISGTWEILNGLFVIDDHGCENYGFYRFRFNEEGDMTMTVVNDDCGRIDFLSGVWFQALANSKQTETNDSSQGIQIHRSDSSAVSYSTWLSSIHSDIR